MAMLPMMMTMMVGAAMMVGWAWWYCIWRPSSLVQACKKQGILGFTLFRLQTSFYAEGSSWNLLKNVQKHGELFYVRFGKLVSLIVLDPLIVQQVLQNAECYEKASYVTALGILGNGVFSASGKDWFDQRQLLSRCFLMKELKDHFETIKSCAKDGVESWTVLDTEIVDVHKLFLTLTVKLICKVAFGESIEEKAASTIFQRFDSYLHQYKKIFSTLLFNFFGYSLKSKQIKEDEEQLMTAIKELVSERERKLGQHHQESNKQRLAIDLMMEKARDNTEFCKNLVFDNSATLLLAGHETTANLLTWTVYLLGTHLHWQEQARAEIWEVEDLDAKQVSQFKTLGSILWEALRLYPPQPIIGRRCTRENIVEGVVIPKGIELIASVSAMHRNKDVWGDDSEEFKPSRFAKGINKACKNPSSFLPFGAGPRTCIGQSLALLEAKVILYYMLKSYSWEISPSYQHCPDVTLTLQPRFGLPIILVKHQHNKL